MVEEKLEHKLYKLWKRGKISLGDRFRILRNEITLEEVFSNKEKH